MAITDFAAHNAEVREMWAAYHRGEPYRVPIIFGINPRYTMWRPEVNTTGMEFEEYSSDPAKMMQRQLEHAWWIRHHLPQDAEMGLPAGWHVYFDCQNTSEAAWFGSPLRFHPRQVTNSEPFLHEDNKRQLFDQGLPDPFTGGIMRRAWEFYDWFQERVAEGYEYQGRPVTAVSAPGLGTDGPVTVACNIRGATEFLTDMLADPDYADELLTYIVDATIARIRAVRAKLGQPLKTPGWGFADDSIQLLSTAMLRERIFPHYRRLLAEFSEGGPHSIHLCGDATRHFKALRDELNITSFDTGYPVDFAGLRRELGPDVQIQGGPSVPFLTLNGPAQIRAEVQRILDSGVLEGRRFILREGNNLAPEVPLEHAEALYDAGRELGKY